LVDRWLLVGLNLKNMLTTEPNGGTFIHEVNIYN